MTNPFGGEMDDDEPDATPQVVRPRTPPVLFEKSPFDEQELQNIIDIAAETASFTKLRIENLGKKDTTPFCIYDNSKCLHPKTTVIFKPKLSPEIAAYLMTACEIHALHVLECLIEGNKKEKFVSKLFLYNLVRLGVSLNVTPQKLLYLLEIFMDGIKTFFTCKNLTQLEMEKYYEDRIICHSVFMPGRMKRYFSIKEVEEVTKLYGRFVRLMPLLHIYYYRSFVLNWTITVYQPPDIRDCESDTHLRIDHSMEIEGQLNMETRPKVFPDQEELSSCLPGDVQTCQDKIILKL